MAKKNNTGRGRIRDITSDNNNAMQRSDYNISRWRLMQWHENRRAAIPRQDCVNFPNKSVPRDRSPALYTPGKFISSAGKHFERFGSRSNPRT